ncbi:hypothetical protein EDD30_0779 [Couchioplanes caeruleus]|uniref:Protein dehydratase n=2 Tax=Couchioplanes caeruleus TaxID=56438 RepID=A0A1K0FPK3_9ACTN|nr:hypothetical protein BG844_08075 [Couchioplanes caeruleus subsp. caeruleus]ROP28072.1 hypothetical protein EDD30_0779 [Couchioplanes caeruleus]
MDEAIHDAARRIIEAGESAPREARDPVNLPAIRGWLEAMGDTNPVYERDGLAPPAMVQVWTMPGLRPAALDPADPLRVMSAVLDDAGFTSIVATNCEQTYERYLRDGERLTVRGRLTGVSGPKRTALGEGWFVTTESIWSAGDEPVASMRFRVLKFRPGTAAPPADPGTLRPVISPDTAFFWAGTAAGELRVQRCGECGALRHPPGPACPRCGATKPEYAVASGAGRIHSYVVHRHPPLPGRRLPVVVALVDLEEGVRIVGELRGADPDQVRIGAPVRVKFVRLDDEVTLPAWRLDAPAGTPLPPWELAVTPTVVISTALATRDFQDVHHDRDAAVRRGGRDIFLNILTTAGLVQRYVTDWAGPDVTLRGMAIRLGAPCHAYDTLTFTGQAREARDGERVVTVSGRTAVGEHVAATVRVAS